MLITYKRKHANGFYETLGGAKCSAKNYIKHKNQRLSKEMKLHYEDFEIVEYELIEKTTHKV